jgi:hypothetical protein
VQKCFFVMSQSHGAHMVGILGGKHL